MLKIRISRSRITPNLSPAVFHRTSSASFPSLVLVLDLPMLRPSRSHMRRQRSRPTVSATLPFGWTEACTTGPCNVGKEEC